MSRVAKLEALLERVQRNRKAPRHAAPVAPKAGPSPSSVRPLPRPVTVTEAPRPEASRPAARPEPVAPKAEPVAPKAEPVVPKRAIVEPPKPIEPPPKPVEPPTPIVAEVPKPAAPDGKPIAPRIEPPARPPALEAPAKPVARAAPAEPPSEDTEPTTGRAPRPTPMEMALEFGLDRPEPSVEVELSLDEGPELTIATDEEVVPTAPLGTRAPEDLSARPVAIAPAKPSGPVARAVSPHAAVEPRSFGELLDRTLALRPRPVER